MNEQHELLKDDLRIRYIMGKEDGITLLSTEIWCDRFDGFVPIMFSPDQTQTILEDCLHDWLNQSPADENCKSRTNREMIETAVWNNYLAAEEIGKKGRL
jgi:hypothetical protein